MMGKEWEEKRYIKVVNIYCGRLMRDVRGIKI